MILGGCVGNHVNLNRISFSLTCALGRSHCESSRIAYDMSGIRFGVHFGSRDGFLCALDLVDSTSTLVGSDSTLLCTRECDCIFGLREIDICRFSIVPLFGLGEKERGRKDARQDRTRPVTFDLINSLSGNVPGVPRPCKI